MGQTGGVAVAPSGDAALAISVPRAPAGKTYEAWVIRAGQAAPAGLFPGRSGTSVVEMARPVQAGSVVAVTLERAGGVTTPTTKPLAQSRRVT
jgi:anti-sigma-K factor RskA